METLIIEDTVPSTISFKTMSIREQKRIIKKIVVVIALFAITYALYTGYQQSQKVTTAMTIEQLETFKDNIDTTTLDGMAHEQILSKQLKIIKRKK